MPDKIMLIDGNSIINRAFYALPALTNKDGIYTHAVYGFLNIMFKFLDEEKPDYLMIAFDLKAPTFRHKQFEQYKGTRKSMPEELRPQIPLLKEVLGKMNISMFELEGYEADDILGTVAVNSEKEGKIVTVVSGDRDLLQLATNNIKIKIPKTKAGKSIVETYKYDDVVEILGVTPKEFIEVKALMGDVSDNIPGVPSIGEKTATKIIQEYKNVENAIENAALVKPKKASENLVIYKEQAILSKMLATIFLEVPIDFDLNKANLNNIYNEESFEMIKKLEFKSLIPRFNKNLTISPETKIVKSIEKYNHIMDLNKIDDYIKVCLKQNLVACSIISFENEILGISFSHKNDKGTFIEINPLIENMVLSKCKMFFESPIPKLCLNSKYDTVYLNKNEIEMKNVVFDAMIAGYIINSSKSTYNYDDIALDFLKEEYDSVDVVFGKGKNKKSALDFTKDEILNYACRQSDVVFRAYNIMDNILKENNQKELYYDIELPLISVLKDMEIYGIKINKEELEQYRDKLELKLNELTKEIYLLTECEFNINSPQQLGIVLFENLGLKGAKKTKTGYKTNHEVLEKLVNEHLVVQKVIDYRTLAKLKSTYADGLLSVLDKKTNKIYSTFNQTVTTTGRISSTEPNLQNIPIKLELGRELRKIFIPTDDSFVFLDGDYSQIELRVLAHMSKDKTLINAFNQSEDIHRLTASQVFNVDLDKVTSEQRSNAKAVNFGIVYGIGAYSLSQDLSISRKSAESYIAGYFEKYPNVKVFLDEIIEQATKDGFATTIFNRRREIPELASQNFVTKNFGQRVAMNMPIQGTAADIIKIAMVKVYKRLKEENLKSRLILQVHDELLLEVKKDELEIVKKIAKEEMENAVKFSIPISTDFHVGGNWYEAK